MGARSVMRFVVYTVKEDESAEHEYEAVCVTGLDADCGARSPCCADLDALAVWQLDHAKETGHRHFRRTVHDYSLVVPVDGSACRLVPTGSGGTS
jgi:hypothetical protein